MATTSFFSSTGPTNTETDAIESSVNAAAASQTAAATSETNAAASATSAASSASSATSSASSASSSSSSATTAKTAAETAKTASEAARDLANTYKDAAATSSATATTKANEASTSATNAANSATAAASSATAAASSASAASTSASNAASSATSAANSAAGLTDEAIQDKVGAMFSSNTETGITMTYQDSDGTIDAVVDTSSLTETLTNKTLTSPVLNTGVSGTAIKDEDNMSSNSATHLATQQSIKAYVDANAGQTTEEVQDIVGAMFSSNTETGITVTYEDSDGTIDLAVGTLNQDTSGTAALATEITVSANNSSDETVYPLFVDGATGSQGAESDTGLNYNPSSGILTATQFTGNLTGNVTGNVSGSSGSTTGNAATSTLASTVTVTDSTSNTNFPVVFHDESNALLDDTGALRYNPSTGTLLVPNLSVAGTTTTVDTVTMEAANAIIFEGATPDNNETTLSIVDPTGDHTQYLINQGGYIPVLAAATTTAITSTPAELNLLDGSSANTVVNSKAVIYGSGGELAGTLSTAAQPSITSVGTLTALTGGTGDLVWDTTTLVVDSSANNVGIGEASPAATLHINTSGNAPLLVESTHGTGGYIELQLSDSGGAGSLTGYIGDSEALIASGTAADLAVRAQANFVVSTGGSTERMRIDSSGNVGIGESSPDGNLHVKSADAGVTADSGANELVVEGSGNSGISILSGASASGAIYYGDSGSPYEGWLQYDHSNRRFNIGVGVATRFSVFSDGNTLQKGSGVEVYNDIFSDSGSSRGAGYFRFRTDGASADQSVAQIYMEQGGGDGAARKCNMYFQVSDNGNPSSALTIFNNKAMNLTNYHMDSSRFYPHTDGDKDLGMSSYRFDVVYATTSTINTSDSREKTTLTALTTNEINASKALAKEFGTYKWLSAVSEKGSNARTHIGITAQKVKEIMEANSLDPTKYAFYCYDEWDATEEETVEYKDKNNMTGESTTVKDVIKPAKDAGNRYGIRYSELHSFIVAGFNARLTALEDA